MPPALLFFCPTFLEQSSCALVLAQGYGMGPVSGTDALGFSFWRVNNEKVGRLEDLGFGVYSHHQIIVIS